LLYSLVTFFLLSFYLIVIIITPFNNNNNNFININNFNLKDKRANIKELDNNNIIKGLERKLKEQKASFD
jgi:hypothetical protein